MTQRRLKAPNLGVILNGHEIEKGAAELHRMAKEEGYPEIAKLAKRLEECMEDIYRIHNLAGKTDPKSAAEMKRIFNKYKHNLPHVIEEVEEEEC